MADLTGGDVTIADLRMLHLAQLIWDEAEVAHRKRTKPHAPTFKRARR